MDQREEFVRLALLPGANRSELCRRFGISRSNAYKWLQRYGREGSGGLAERSRRPHASPRRSAPEMEEAVLGLRKASKDAWGARKIAAVLRREGGVGVPAASTITAILRRHGRLEARSSEHPGPYQRFERAQPNELWQMDFKGHFPVGRGRCHPLGVLDDHSRYALGLEACADEQDATVRDRLRAIFRRHGLPLAMLMDNGAPWGDAGDQPYTVFTIWLMRLGVRVAHGRPRHPQTQGKQERFHRTLKVELLNGRSFADLGECQRAFDGWRQHYNHYRPHQALALATPADRYRASPRSFPERLPTIEYGLGDRVRKVDRNGDISFTNRSWTIGKAFRGQPVALRATLQDGVLNVHFCAQLLGAIDLRAGKYRARGFVDDPLRGPAPPAPVTPDSGTGSPSPTTPPAQQLQ